MVREGADDLVSPVLAVVAVVVAAVAVALSVSVAFAATLFVVLAFMMTT